MTYNLSEYSCIPILCIHILHCRNSQRITILAFFEVIPNFQILFIIEIFINTDISAIFFPSGTKQLTSCTGDAIFILCILRHIAVSRYKIMPGIIASSATGIVQRIFMFMPRTSRYVDTALTFYATFTGYNIDYTTGCITAILSSARSLDNFNLINIFHIDDLVNISAGCLRTRFAIGTKFFTYKVIYATAVNQKYNTRIAIDGNTILARQPAVFTITTIAGILEIYARNTFNSLSNICIMTFFNFLTSNNFNVTAGTIVGLLSNSIAELVFYCVSLYYHCIKGIIVQVFVICRTCACAQAHYHHHSSRSCISSLHVTHTLLS